MNAKQTKVAQAAQAGFNFEPTSVKDAGYKLAVNNEGSRTIAQFVMDKAPALLADLKVNNHKELRADLAEGYKLRANELWGVDYYILSKDTGAWLKIANSLDPSHVKTLEEHKGREIRQVNVHLVTAITGNEYGKMASSDPAQRAVIEPMRDKWRKYESDRNASLIKSIKDILAEQKGETVKRETLTFVESITKMFTNFEKSVLVRDQRGTDTTANPLRFKMAVDAFWKTYNAK